MKKVVYTVLMLTALCVQSCQKEHFQPNQVTCYPFYSDKGRSHEATNDNTTNGDNTPIPITDPNSDRDDKSRKRN